MNQHFPSLLESMWPSSTEVKGGFGPCIEPKHETIHSAITKNQMQLAIIKIYE
jgi:hypothetical protein